jgi:hypothetical protein
MIDATTPALTASDTITVIEGLDAMRILLTMVWRRLDRDPRNIAFVLGATRLADGTPVDAAMWKDWLAATAACRPDRNLTNVG